MSREGIVDRDCIIRTGIRKQLELVEDIMLGGRQYSK